MSTVATIRFAAATSADMAQAAIVLQTRFRELNPSHSSSFTVIVGEQDIVLEFRGEAPPDQTIRDYSTQGVLRIYPADATRNWLVTDRDIEEVSARQGDAGAMLDIKVRDSAAQRLQSYTSRNVGRVLVTNWDGKEQSRATVRGVFSRQFQTTGLDRATALRMRIMLESGRLPVAVREIGIVHPAPAAG